MIDFLLYLVAPFLVVLLVCLAIAVWDAARRAGIDREIARRARSAVRGGPQRPPGLDPPPPPPRAP